MPPTDVEKCSFCENTKKKIGGGEGSGRVGSGRGGGAGGVESGEGVKFFC